MNYVGQVFEILGVKPHQSFRIDDTDGQSLMIDNDLNVYFARKHLGSLIKSNIDIRDILVGNYEIMKEVK